MIKTIIVEDDPMVAAINKKYTETVPGFQVAGVFRNGAEGLEYLRENPVDLVILDYYMPEMNGDVFMDRIREEGIQVSVIMVTSANSADTVRSLLLKGVRDYLVKPFELERFQAALERFRSAKELLTGAGSGMDQSELDRLFAGNAGSTVERNKSLELPKGLNGKTLEMVRSKMKENAGKKMTSEEIALMVGLSRITVRRYLGYLQDCGELTSEIDYRTGGRPGILYRCI